MAHRWVISNQHNRGAISNLSVLVQLIAQPPQRSLSLLCSGISETLDKGLARNDTGGCDGEHAA